MNWFVEWYRYVFSSIWVYIGTLVLILTIKESYRNVNKYLHNKIALFKERYRQRLEKEK